MIPKMQEDLFFAKNRFWKQSSERHRSTQKVRSFVETAPNVSFLFLVTLPIHSHSFNTVPSSSQQFFSAAYNQKKKQRLSMVEGQMQSNNPYHHMELAPPLMV